MKIINRTATKTFLKLVALAKANKGYTKIDNNAGLYMPLSVEKIDEIEGYELYSLAHYGKQMGDLMADPEMCFLLAQNENDAIVIPYSFRNDYLGICTTDILFENGKIRGVRKKAIAKNVAFANTWLETIKQQQKIK
ncbi:DUF6908 domain-containing protein [Aquimarina longa]|uniref:DUF6908 domain-containing protein n=1 Tax=Aquimarina longa TaxID=1080221 RepID=UPI0007804E70|nr:hypothetical protein [Aquimarina longa]